MRFPDWSARLQELGLASEVAAGWFRGIVALLKHGSASGGVVTREVARVFWKGQKEAGNAEVGVWGDAYKWYCAQGQAGLAVKHDEVAMSEWEQGLFRAMRVGQYRERTWETYRQWAGRFDSGRPLAALTPYGAA